MNSEWKEIIEQEMEREAEAIMEEVNSDPALKDVQAPPDMYEGLMKKIREYEKQKVYDQLSEEDREYLRVGKTYMKRRRLNRYIVLVAALVFVLAFGTVSLGEDRNIFDIISRMLGKEEQIIVDSENIEPIICFEEDEAYKEIETIYGFTPVKLEYLPCNAIFCETTISKELQTINMVYEIDSGASIIYIIRPNFRESSFGTVIEDEKVQEYTIETNNVVVSITEYSIVESGTNKWSVSFTYQDIQYLLRVSDIEQEEIETIVKHLRFIE